ncbi:hypothetical protein [Acinetobacter indicus]|uniref:hypothetical protein n=1 Tax=Acinetobacter indicus TaxID=756892 RepID=UPI0025769F91|nr:hypothetical protein [Acinetobacter indicus]MDM1328908.1 hypothetical protein [Acinetobacter indicus]
MVNDPQHKRIVVTAHPNLGAFIELVKYDPSNPAPINYKAIGMQEMHKQTQSDFKGQKAANRLNFIEYLQEGERSERTLYLPTISGWQSSKFFDKTVFVSFDDHDPNVLYGQIFLPTAPIMQADGQTQTAALFRLADSKEGEDTNLNVHENLVVTLEIELNVNVEKAVQSFADRNGRGSKKIKI